jgi:Bacteriophage head to tail connecting protein
MPSEAAQRRYGNGDGLDAAHPFYYGASPSLLAEQPAKPEGAQPQAPSYLGWPELFKHLEARLAAEKTWRLSWWRNWGDIARFELPRRYHAFITENDYNRGIRRDGAILDNTATLDGETCAGGIMTVCTDPDRQWLKLGPPPGVEVDRAGQMFFDDLTERLRFVQDETNFYESLNQYYEDKVFFGTGVAIDYEDAEDIFVCRNPCAGEFCLASGADNEDQSLFVEERRTVAQIVEMFGLENCPDQIRDAWRQKGGALEQETVVGHAIEPNFALDDGVNGSVGQLPGHFTWREVYWIIGRAANGPLSIAGFNEKPFAASQWHRVSNDPYGRGPGYTVLGDTIELQILTARQAELVEKLARPPMTAPVALKNEPHSIKPDQTTYYDATTGAPQFKPIFEVNAQGLPAITAAITTVQERIHRGMHADLFRMIQELSERAGEKTATEIDALREERLMQLGPVIGRVYRYGIRPRIKRQLAIMHRRGLWPRVPSSMARIPLQIEFISMLTLAQRAGAVSSIERTFAFAQAIYSEFPESQDVLDADEAIREAASLRGAPTRIVRAAPDVRKLRAKRQQAMAAQQAGQTAMAAVGGAKALSETSLGNDNALGAILGGGGR